MGKHRKPRNNDESSSEDDDSNSICINEEDENELANGNGNGNGSIAVNNTNNANTNSYKAERNPVAVENVANEEHSHVPDIEDTVGDHDMKLRKMEALDKTK
jgi:hypothetical protein